MTAKRPGKALAGKPEAPLALAATGMEAELELWIDGERCRPEDVFGDPTAFVRGELMHRQGTSYHLPTGGALYFDTGVIEVATPVIEIERGAAARAGRQLWEAIRFVRGELDAWERGAGAQARLAGFSMHYNVSFELPRTAQGLRRTLRLLALLLTYILPFPVMLLATNRRSSTGVGVRPRGNRLEVTADFTPEPALSIATGSLILGIVRAVMSWPSYELSMLERMEIPVVAGFAPVKHASRQGWVAHRDGFPANPFACDVDSPSWPLRDGRLVSLRGLAGAVTRRFWPSIRRLTGPFSLRLIGGVMRGHAPSLLDLPDRPPAYEDVGRLCTWDDLFPERLLSRSRYEQVLIRAVSGHKLRLGGHWYTPANVRGWTEVVFQRDDGTTHVFPLDFLVRHLRNWEPRRPHGSRRTHAGSTQLAR
ncbi:MAG TPA: hypothetical protein VH988_25765 [Thermoanaerobaculia bacterium]|nr:hypothetical protein [Thermoanaerobaculia bacterium]